MGGVHHQQHDFGEGDGADRVGGGELLELLLDLGLAAQAGGVDQADLAVVPFPFDGDGVAGDAGFRAGQHAVLADQAVDQGRLASVGATDDGDQDRLVGGVLLFLEADLRVIAGQQRIEIGHALAVLARNRKRLAEAERPGLGDAGVAGAALGLVGGEDHRPLIAAQDAGEDLVARGDALAGVDQEQHHVRFLDGQFGLGAHARFQAVVVDVLEAGRVDQDQVEVAQAAAGEAAVAGDAGPVVDDGELLAGQPVEQRGLADVRPADDGEFEGHADFLNDFDRAPEWNAVTG